MIIYKVTNLKNQKVYIGQTVLSLAKRKRSHYKEAKYKNNNNYFHNALNSYSKDDFKWEILEESINSIDDLNKKEIYYISLFDSTNKDKGYNLKSGGNGGGLNSEDTKIKIGKSTKERWQNSETAEKMLAGLHKGIEKIKIKAQEHFKYDVCLNCGKEIKHRKEYHIKFCCYDCRKNYLKTHNKGFEIANSINKEKKEQEYSIVRNKIIDWCKNNSEYFTNIKYNELSEIFSIFKSISGLKDERSIMKTFGFTSRKTFIKELSKIYAVQV